MKRNKSNLTLFVLVALVIVCGGSFAAVKALNSKTEVAKPAAVITATTPFITSSDASQSQFFSTTEAPTNSYVPTVPIATTKPKTSSPLKVTSDKAEETTRNPFTTFANGANRETNPETTRVTTTAPTTQKQPAANSTTEAQEVIENAAVFSDGFLGFLYEPNGNYYYTKDDPWQRNFGFNEAYDTAAPVLIFYYDTFRCKFTYDNKDWLIQFWKGQYGFVFLGAEVGVYNKPSDRKIEHYDCADDNDSLMMSMTFYRKGKKLMSRGYGKYWWCTGFVPGKLDKFSDRSELSMDVRITMKDYKMLLSFCAAMKDNGFKLNKDFSTNGLDVFIKW